MRSKKSLPNRQKLLELLNEVVPDSDIREIIALQVDLAKDGNQEAIRWLSESLYGHQGTFALEGKSLAKLNRIERAELIVTETMRGRMTLADAKTAMELLTRQARLEELDTVKKEVADLRLKLRWLESGNLSVDALPNAPVQEELRLEN